MVRRKVRKTKAMIAAETKLGGDLEELLPNLITQLGIVDAGREAGVSKATLGYWMLKLGMRRVNVCLREGERVCIQRVGGAIELVEEE